MTLPPDVDTRLHFKLRAPGSGTACGALASHTQIIEAVTCMECRSWYIEMMELTDEVPG